MMQCWRPVLQYFEWRHGPLLGGAPKTLKDWLADKAKEEQVEEARPLEAAVEDGTMVPVEAAEPLGSAVEGGAGVVVEAAEEPAALNSLQSCGGHWQSQCLQTPPCQKHAVAAAFMQMLVPVQKSIQVGSKLAPSWLK